MDCPCDRLDRRRAVDLVARVAAAVEVPVTADIERGYADTDAGVAETVEGVIGAGAVGINIEDAHHATPLRPVGEQAGRIAAARRAAEAALDVLDVVLGPGDERADGGEQIEAAPQTGA